MKQISKIFMVLLATTGMMVLFNSCKKDFDSPPGPADPNLVANTTIKDLKALHQTQGAFDIVQNDLIISGVVVANDKSGNLYKQIFIEDSTGGLQILLDANSLYNSYPVGRRVFIKCKGLSLSDYNRLISLGMKTLVDGLNSQEGIPSALIGNYVIGGSINNPVVPHVVSADDDLTTGMQDRYMGTLVKLNDYQFVEQNTTYSDTSAAKSTTNRTIKPCSGANQIVRTSGYANFAGVTLPSGHGSMTAIYTVYGNTKQFLIRDTTDVQFTGPRGCPLPPGTLLLETFEDQNVPPTGFDPVSIPGWQNLTQSGTNKWLAKIFSNNKYAENSAFGSGAASVISWMVTKGVNLDATTNEKLSFETKQGYIGTGGALSAALKILVSTNYDGTSNPWSQGTWTDITSQAILSPGAAAYPTNFTPSGDISLNSYTGTIYVAFRYEGADPTGTSNDKTSNWQVDNVKILGN